MEKNFEMNDFLCPLPEVTDKDRFYAGKEPVIILFNMDLLYIFHKLHT